MTERTPAYWKLRKRIEKIVDKRKDIFPSDDGYLAFCPSGRGYHTAAELRILADILDDRNKEWDEEVHRELRK